MDESEIKKLERIAKEIGESRTVQRSKSLYPIDIFVREDGLIIRIALRERGRGLVDTLDIRTNSDGLVYPEEAIQKIVLAFEVGQEDSLLKAAGKRLRRMSGVG